MVVVDGGCDGGGDVCFPACGCVGEGGGGEAEGEGEALIFWCCCFFGRGNKMVGKGVVGGRKEMHWFNGGEGGWWWYT